MHISPKLYGMEKIQILQKQIVDGYHSEVKNCHCDITRHGEI